MPEFKPGDNVWVGPFQIEQFRSTYAPGPQDNGDTAILRRHPGFGVTSADTALLLPDVPHLPQIARYLAEHPETVEALEEVIRRTSIGTRQALLSGLVRAMRGEGGNG